MQHWRINLKEIIVVAELFFRQSKGGSLRHSRKFHDNFKMAPVSAPSPARVFDSITKSASDKRDYRGLELSNGLKVLLISDSETDKSAGALSVGVGAMCDPVELPGLAHFCEHMLFLGTKKYPVENDFDKFLCSHGGGSNASTYTDHTVYRFDVAPDHFGEALDRFAQFFIDPLFNEDSTEREVNAVNSENDKNIPNDIRRAHMVEKTVADQSHAFSKFSTGNLYSLWTRPKEKSINVREELLTFHHKYYSANIMALAVLGKEKLDELQVMVEGMFSPIVNKDIELPNWPESPYPESVCQLRINVSPIKDLRKISVLFPAPDVTNFYKTASIQYLTHLVGHEGPGSLLSLLKRKNWVNRLSSWSDVCGRGSAEFRVEMDLSIEGWEQRDVIVEHLFQYIKMLQELGPQQWVWEEIRDINDIKFRFKEKSRAQFYVNSLAMKIHNCPNLEDILSAGFLMTEYRPDIIANILSGFTPERCRITTLSKANEAISNLTEFWYNAKYSIDKIDSSLLNKWKNCVLHAELKLPPKNEFISAVFDLKPRENTGIIPRVLMHNQLTTGWFLQDNEFLLPKASHRVELFSPLPLLDPISYALNYMTVEMVIDDLTEFAYMAELAELWYGIKGTVYGIEMDFNGYDHKLNLLMYEVLERLLSFQCNPTRMSVLLERYKRSLKNWEDEEPRIHANWYLTAMLTQKNWTRQELLEVLDDITMEKLQNYVKQFISNLKLNLLIFGNLTSQESADVMKRCQDIVLSKGTKPLSPENLARSKEIRITTGSDLVFKRNHLVHSNSCAVVFFQAGLQSDRENVLLSLLDQLFSEAYFSKLRTQEQLGYIVGIFVKKFRSTIGFALLVQSIYHPDYLESRIDNFLQCQYDVLKEMSDEEFAKYKAALAVVIAEKPKTLEGRAARLWNEIIFERYNFDRQNMELQELDTISKEELLACFEHLFGRDSKRRAAVHIISMADDGAGKKVQANYPNPILPTERIVQQIDNLNQWKVQQELFGDGKKYMTLPEPDSI